MIHIKVIPHDEQRYDTVGDYWRDPDGTLQIRISAMGNPSAELLVAVHELIEQMLTEAAGISNEAIDTWDMSNPQLDDPGADVRAPYHAQHVLAEGVERIVCVAMGMSWADYCAVVDGVR